jgi:hypothetical protein
VQKDSKRDYKNGTLPSGKTLADYHKFIRKSMFVKLNGRTGDIKSNGKGEDDTDDISDNKRDEDNDTGKRIV